MRLIVFIIIIAILSVLAAYRYHLRLKAKAREYAAEAKLLHEKLERLTAPSHYFNDDELRLIKREFRPLLGKVSRLYRNPFISNAYLDKLGLDNLIDEREHLNHAQWVNNQLQKQK